MEATQLETVQQDNRRWNQLSQNYSAFCCRPTPSTYARVSLVEDAEDLYIAPAPATVLAQCCLDIKSDVSYRCIALSLSGLHLLRLFIEQAAAVLAVHHPPPGCGIDLPVDVPVGVKLDR